MALSLLFALRTSSPDPSHPAQLSLPSTCLLVSPFIDIGASNSAVHTVARKDPILSPKSIVEAGRVWAGMPPKTLEPAIPEDAMKNALLNPGVIDPAVFLDKDIGEGEGGGKKTRFIVASGQWDLLHPDVVLFVDKCEKAGLGPQMTYVEGEKMIHCFPLGMNYAPEANRAAEIIIDFIKDSKA
jgi:acetyl esterase/lipase